MNATALKSEDMVVSDFGTQEFVTVHVGDQILGVGVKEIHDVFALSELTPVPGARKEIAGVLNLRGRIVTAIDARVILGLPPRENGYAGVMAVGVEHKGESYGVLVDSVGEVLRLKDSEFEANPINMDAKWKNISRGIYRLEGKLLMTIDIEKLLVQSNQNLGSKGQNMKSCLVVDDSRVIRKVARRILEDMDFQVNEAEDGQAALRKCQQEMPDAVLLDWNMPVMNGIDFLRELRSSPGGEAPVVVFCTTENDMSSIVEAMEAGANEYIMKPFDSEIVQSKFAEVGLI